MIKFWIVVLLLVCSVPAQAAEPVKQVGIYVEPFYRSAPAPGGTPQVKVGARYDALLASPRREDVLAVRDMVLPIQRW